MSLSFKCPLSAHVFEHLVLSWWYSLGKLRNPQEVSHAEGNMSLGVDLEVL